MRNDRTIYSPLIPLKQNGNIIVPQKKNTDLLTDIDMNISKYSGYTGAHSFSTLFDLSPYYILLYIVYNCIII